MGLAGIKKKTKLSHDPNNTAWSRSTSSFGHKILSQQGWQPGQYLGAENANHSDHYTAANASHIRIQLRDDNLGLGAKIGSNKAETFGLSLFSGVLGRLNGKSEEVVQKQQDALRDAELRQYQMGKYGMMNFVSGGLLVGDKMEEPKKMVGKPAEVKAVGDGAHNKKGKKRKAEAEDESSSQDDMSAKKRKSRKASSDGNDDAIAKKAESENFATEVSSKKSKKEKRRAEKAEADEPSEIVSTEQSKNRRKKDTSDSDASPKISAADKARLKAEKRARKDDRRRRKEEKRLKRAAKEAAKPAEVKQVTISQPVNGGRHAVRHRYIQQKRMAGMDAQAMKEIFMIKGAA